MAYPYLSDLVRDMCGIDLPIPIPMFGVMVAAAFLISMWLLQRELARFVQCGSLQLPQRRVKSKNGRLVEHLVQPQEIAGELSAIAAVAGIIGARIFSLLEHPHDFLADPWSMIFTRTGFTYYGGVIFGVIAGIIYLKKLGLPIRVVLDAVAPAIMMGYGIGRIGCQLSGDGDWGIAANLALKPDWLPAWCWAQMYEHNIAGIVVAPPGVYPTPLYELLMALGAFAILWIVRKHPFKAGWLFSLFLLLTGIERYLIEQIRVNAVLHIFGIAATQAEIISVMLIVMGIVGLALLSKRPPAISPSESTAASVL